MTWDCELLSVSTFNDLSVLDCIAHLTSDKLGLVYAQHVRVVRRSF